MSVFNQKCDECGCKSLIRISDSDEICDVRQKMKSDGWIFKHAKSYCPTCAQLHPATIPVPQPEYAHLKLAEETLLALEWSQQFVGCPGYCSVCPVYKTCLEESWTEDCNTHVIQHTAEWLKAYRERAPHE